MKKVLLLTAIAFIFISCLQDTDSSRSLDAETLVKNPIITFISGDVFKLTNGSWEYTEIGETLAEDSSVKTESDSYCEIQFSNKAVIRISENSEINMQTVGITDKNSSPYCLK